LHDGADPIAAGIGTLLPKLVWQGIKYFIGVVVISLVGLFIGILTNAHLEISLKRPSLTASWRDLVDVDLDFIRPRIFHAYYGDNSNGKTTLRRAIFSLRHFSLANRVVGTKERDRSKIVGGRRGGYPDCRLHSLTSLGP